MTEILNSIGTNSYAAELPLNHAQQNWCWRGGGNSYSSHGKERWNKAKHFAKCMKALFSYQGNGLNITLIMLFKSKSLLEKMHLKFQ
jgi:hypothetical protein